jgi:high-affinity iron transporter
MLISSVIFVLQETLEAALLISVLMAISHQQSLKWLFVSLLAGALLSFIYASNMHQVSEWFDYVGQEVINATLHATITLSIILFSWSLSRSKRHSQNKIPTLYFISSAASVTFAITLEGSEILIYFSSFLQEGNQQQTVAIGSSVGFAIGISIGILLFYILRALPASLSHYVPIFLLALFAGNMLSQFALQLTQADWIPAAQAVWDTSEWLPESSIAGKLLYALIGYEATPSLIQIICYLMGTGLVLAFSIIRSPSKITNQTAQENFDSKIS